jgi:hypothetical protein
MTFRFTPQFASTLGAAALLCGCTSVKVNKLTQEKLPKVLPKDVSQANPSEAAQRPHTKIATIDMKTHSPFAANLNTLAHERTGKLGGNAYVITGGTATSSISGTLVGVFADKTEASMNIDVLHWNSPPPGAANPKPGTSAQAEAPAKKKKKWYWPFG